MNASQPTPARIAANRENATHSTGPQTLEGKARASRNAVTHALTGRTVLLATDDVELYNEHIASIHHQFRPITPEELALVQSIADTSWRLQRIPHLLLALSAKGREDFEDAFPELGPEERAARIELETELKYEKQIRNLSLQEARLHRRRSLDVAELRVMIRERDRRRAEELSVASKMYLAAQQESQPFDPSDLGFDFSLEEVECYINGKRAALIARDYFQSPAERSSHSQGL